MNVLKKMLLDTLEAARPLLPLIKAQYGEDSPEYIWARDEFDKTYAEVSALEDAEDASGQENA